MNKRILWIILIITLTACNNKKSEPINHAEWLVGTWESKDDFGNASYESWEKISKHELSGKSYVIMEADTFVIETIQLLQQKDSLFYIATVNGQNKNQPIRFSLVSLSEDAMSFENAKHNFPQAVSYKKTNSDSLVAEISGHKDGEELKIAIPMRKIK